MTGQTCVFISDVHLGAFSSEKETEVENSLLSLIEHCSKHQFKIYILGDLLDYWMEYPRKKYVPEVGSSVLEAFKKYNSKHQPITFITGNHDNWDYGYFKRLGFDVESNFRILRNKEIKTLLMHGDGYFNESGNLVRPFFHRILRNQKFVTLFQRVFPPSIGINIMKYFSRFSKLREITNGAPLNAHANEILSTKNVDVVLMGHDHIPRVETFNGGTYINLGTFYEHKTLALYTNNEYELVRWSGSNKEFVPYNESKAAK